jgi:polyphenol oxidase
LSDVSGLNNDSDTIADLVIHPDWSAPARVHAVVTMRGVRGESRPPFDAFNLGVHCGDDTNAVASNRAMLVSALHLPAAPCWLRQVHGTSVAVFDAPPIPNRDLPGRDLPDRDPPVADAAIARTPGIVLSVLTADCLPLLVYADDGSEIAAIHAGWRGLAGGVIERCVEQLRAPRERLLVWLGPAIGPHSYEVGDEVRDAFVAQNPHAVHAFVATRPGHWLCNLYTLARLRLAALGVNRISGGDFDTYADARFYSYRRDKITGRFASLIWLAD